jgi:cytochrome c556
MSPGWYPVRSSRRLTELDRRQGRCIGRRWKSTFVLGGDQTQAILNHGKTETSMKAFIAAGVVTVCALAAQPARTQEGKEQDINFWMKKKLDYSQAILSGLATADFDAINKNATSMDRLSKLEKFVRRSDAEEYRAQLRVFLAANKDLIKATEKKNIDGATLAFTQMTLSCVNCHKALRDEKKKK